MEKINFEESEKEDDIDRVIRLKNFLKEKLNFSIGKDGLALESIQELDNYRKLIDYLESEFGKKEENEMEKREMFLDAERITDLIDKEGGRAYVVGGYARDEALKRFGYEVDSKDIDLEVYGLSIERIREILSGEFDKINLVGQSFQVLKVNSIDVSIPRRDSKIENGKKHTDFKIEGDPEMDIEEAARRRDFTINALLFDLKTGEIIDPCNGLEDLQNKIIRHVDDETFGDDPLRVLRAMQFAGRFGFDIDKRTIEIARELPLDELSKERFFEEWSKLLMKSPQPSVGLEAGKKLGIFKKMFPELERLEGIEQDSEWHPEGNVWEHTKSVVDAAAMIARERNLSKENHFLLMLSALCHDLGKIETTKNIEGRIVCHGHERAGESLTREFLGKINAPKLLIEHIVPLIREHMVPNTNKDFSDAMVRRLAKRLHPATIDQLALLAKADKGGRGKGEAISDSCDLLLQKAEELNLKHEAPRLIKMASYFMEEGIKPGPFLGVLEALMFEEQLEGKFFDFEEAVEHFEKNRDLLMEKAELVIKEKRNWKRNR